MSGLNSAGDMPDLSELDNKVYVNSFLTQIAQGMTVSNDIGQSGYLDYLYDMDNSWYYAIVEDTGAALTDNLYTTVTTGRGESATERVMSLSGIKAEFTRVLEDQDPQYAQLAYLVDYLGDVVSVMPGTYSFDASAERDTYAEYILSQYDIIDGGRFPQSSDEAVLVVGGNNDLTDLLLAQLGYIDQDTFLGLFNLGGGDTGDENPDIGADEGYLSYTFDYLKSKPYTLYFNDEAYTKNESYNMSSASDEYAFEYVSDRGEWTGSELDAAEGEGTQIRITAVLRLKDGLTYGCLSDGLNVTGTLVEEYIRANMQSELVQWLNTELDLVAAATTGAVTGGKISAGEDTSYYLCPAENLYDNFSSYYMRLTAPTGGDLTEEELKFYALFAGKVITSSAGNEQTLKRRRKRSPIWMNGT